MSSSDSNDLRVQVEVLKERLSSSEMLVRQQLEQIRELRQDLRQKETSLDQLTADHYSLRLRWEVLRRDTDHTKTLLIEARKATRSKIKKSRTRALLVSILFLLSSVLVSLATNMFFSPPLRTLAWSMLTVAAVIYVVAAIMTIYLESGRKS